MFSKFDDHIMSDELVSHEPTQADWEEYHAWLEEQEAAEPLPEPEPELSDFDPHRDFYAGMEDEDPSEYPQEPWDDDYSDYDPVDMYAAEWENYAMRDWD